MSFAIVGMSCRVPGASTLEQFWHNIVSGSCEITKSSGLTDWNGWVPAFGLVDRSSIDTTRFRLPPHEAVNTNPQTAALLACTWEALADAHYEAGNHRVGVFCAANNDDFAFQRQKAENVAGTAKELQIKIHSELDYVATKIAHKFGFTGPAIHFQTACSSSLVALHTALIYLANGDCEVAVVGGACIRTPVREGYFAYPHGPLSPTGECRTFDERANGAVPGEGVGVVVLKRSTTAARDGDRVYAHVLGTAVNNDGSLRAGFTAPGVEGQKDLLSLVLSKAATSAASVRYVEAHCTGTPIGDRIELRALAETLGPRVDDDKCGLGAIKSSIGHLESASGIVAFIKVGLCLHHRTLPATSCHKDARELIDGQNSLRLISKPEPWSDPDGRNVALVTSLGMGGTNACAILAIDAAPPLSSDNSGEWDHATSDLSQPTYKQSDPDGLVDAVSAAYVLRAWRDLGLGVDAGAVISEAELKRIVSDKYIRVTRLHADHLERLGYLAFDGSNTWTVTASGGRLPSQIESIHETLDQIAAFTGIIGLLRIIGPRLPSVLRSEESPLKYLLGPTANTAALHVYRASPNALKVRDVTTRMLRANIRAGQRVLEIGGGTASTTPIVIDAVDDIKKYSFTDISMAFLTRAKQTYHTMTCFEASILDVARPFSEQGFDKYDLIVASNVLHATPDIASSLRHCRDALSQDGKLLLIEATEGNLWLDVTFGLTDGWWSMTDQTLRPKYPLLAPLAWQKLLDDLNLTGEIEFHPGTGTGVQTGQMVALVTNKEGVNLKVDEVSQSRSGSGEVISSLDLMCLLWSDVFDKAAVYYEDNFFDLGGDSLTAVELCGLIEKHYSVLPAIAAVFDHSTPRELLKHVQNMTRESGNDYQGPKPQ